MKFSIIIPTFNRCHILWKCLLSIKNQSYSNFEVLIIDDGSDDKTKALVSEFTTDPRFKYFYQENAGAAAARNLGLEKAIGDIITYVDSDEELYLIYLQTALEFFKNPQVVYATSNYNRVLEKYDSDFNIVERINHSSAQLQNIKIEDIFDWRVKTCGTGIFHKNNINTKWDSSFKLLEDLDFLMSIERNFPNSFVHIPYALFEYRQRYNTDGLCSQASYEDFALAFMSIYEKHGEALSLSEDTYMNRYRNYMEKESLYQLGEIPQMRDAVFG